MGVNSPGSPGGPRTGLGQPRRVLGSLGRPQKAPKGPSKARRSPMQCGVRPSCTKSREAPGASKGLGRPRGTPEDPSAGLGRPSAVHRRSAKSSHTVSGGPRSLRKPHRASGGLGRPRRILEDPPTVRRERSRRGLKLLGMMASLRCPLAPLPVSRS